MLVKKVESVVARRPAVVSSNSSSKAASPAGRSHLNGFKRKESTPRRSLTPATSRPGSKEPAERVRNGKVLIKSNKRAPDNTTPQFTDSEDEEEAQPKKRIRIEEIADPKRKIRYSEAFTADGISDSTRVHAKDIANSDLQQNGKYVFMPFFEPVAEDEELEPIVELEYPGATSQPEEWQIVKPKAASKDDGSDEFMPISEIFENVKTVAKYFLDEVSARKVFDEDNDNGLYQVMDRARRRGAKGTVGSQTIFLKAISDYNALIRERREAGSIAHAIDQWKSIPKDVVYRITSETYSRTVSLHNKPLHNYQSFSSEVYGELLPRFLTQIFKETKLQSDQVFVDLGSGVGNCVAQAALETGCAAWGCEIKENYAKVAELQKEEFAVRCKLWGVEPGPVHLIRDDFTKNKEIGKVLQTADVILLNNEVFESVLNDNIKLMFMDLKEGAQIVSLKYYRDPQQRITATTENDPTNSLRVKERERFSKMVSWTSAPGKWYIHTKDSTELNTYLKAKEKRERRDKEVRDA